MRSMKRGPESRPASDLSRLPRAQLEREVERLRQSEAHWRSLAQGAGDSAESDAGPSEAHRLISMGRMFGGASHNLRNRMSGIEPLERICRRVLAALDEDRVPSEAERRMLAKRLETHVEARVSIMELVDNVLGAAAGRGVFESVDLNERVRNVVMLSAHVWRGRGISVYEEYDDRIPAIRCRPAEVAEAVDAILSNACDASDAGSDVDVFTSLRGTHAAVSVVDRGTGMDASAREKAFSYFFTTKDEGQGTGLGLSRAQQVVSAHGGDIRMTTHDAQPGRGTIMEIVLPIGGPA